MDIDGALINDDFFAPNGIQQVLSAENSPKLHCKRHEQSEFFRPELELLFAYDRPASLGFNVELSAVEHCRWSSRRNRTAAHGRANAGQQFTKCERLDDIVIST